MNSQRIVFLLVEDDHDHAVLMLRYIERTRMGSIVHRVKDGEEALAFLRREGSFGHAPRPDVILLDLKLPKYDGHEVLAQIKADPDLRRIPVIVLSTSAAELDRLKAFDLDCSNYLVKPLDREEFSQMIEQLRCRRGGCNQAFDEPRNPYAGSPRGGRFPREEQDPEESQARGAGDESDQTERAAENHGCRETPF